MDRDKQPVVALSEPPPDLPVRIGGNRIGKESVGGIYPSVRVFLYGAGRGVCVCTAKGRIPLDFVG